MRTRRKIRHGRARGFQTRALRERFQKRKKDVANTMFTIKFAQRAIEDLQVFPAYEQKGIVAELESQLASDAAEESDDRSRLGPHEFAEWTIRLGDVRVFYDVDIANRPSRSKPSARSCSYENHSIS